MSIEELKELFRKYSEDLGTDYKPSALMSPTTRGDLNAMILLNDLLPKNPTYRDMAPDMVSCAEHDQIWLDIDMDELAAVITEEQVRALNHFGVFVDSDTDSLSMFV